jgi:hypothetical protein
MRQTLIALSLSLACGSAIAQQADTVAPEIEPGTFLNFIDYDADRNGTVTMAEFLAKVAPGDQSVARACDTDGDGLLSGFEHEACGSQLIARARPQPMQG